jgi:hypothetical protein
MTNPKIPTEAQELLAGVATNSIFTLVIDEEGGKSFWEEHGSEIIRATIEKDGNGPDYLIFDTPKGTMLIDGQSFEMKQWPVLTTFFPVENKLAYMIGHKPIVSDVPPEIPGILVQLQAMTKRNELAGFAMPDALLTAIKKSPTESTEHFPIHTSQECDAFMKSVGDGRSGTNWRNIEQRSVRVWEQRGTPYRIEVDQRQEDEEGEGLTFAAIEELTKAQSIDSAFALYYICGVLSPPEEERRLVGGWIDLNDVMKHIGWMREKPDAARREELRAQVWEFLKHGARARLVGERSIAYKDLETGELIPTRLDSTPWKITDTQRPQAEPNGVPIRAYIVISQQWTPLLTSPLLSQYMPLGELLAAIPPGNPSGDWARTMSLALARFWRMKPRETIARTFCPTRRELIMTYVPKTPPSDVLASRDPKRAAKYYREALQYLAEGGFIAWEGDAAKDVTVDSMLESYGRQGWAQKWLDASSGIFPGDGWQPTVEERAAALPPIKRKDLKAKPKKRLRKMV